ncbi:hypothetical protein [Zavarzinella formosa]|uniref:hypothetical protein n=1 Tax=Zavarzinella formosa TaxID=360055 RepID=UPI0012FC1DC6|nr:hypothetical protein [Zavarzinella formosa]
MSMNRWKVAACTLTLGVGGLAVFATDKKESPKDAPPAITVKPATPAAGSDTPSGPVKAPLKELTTEPAKTPPPAIEFELDLPSVPAPALPVKQVVPAPDLDIPAPATGKALPHEEAPPPKPASTLKTGSKDPVFVPVDLPDLPPEIVPVKAEADTKKEPVSKPDALKKDEPKPAVGKPDMTTPKFPILEAEESFDIKLPSAPKAPETAPPPLPETKKPEAPKPTIAPPVTPLPPKVEAPLPPPVVLTPPAANPLPPLNEVSKPVPAPLPPDSVKLVPSKPVETTPAPAAARLKMTLRMGDGKPRFEIRNTSSEEILLKVYGEKIEMSAPQDGRPSTLAGVSAIGHVKFTAPGIEGTCEHLTILSGTGEVLMKGNIHLKTKRGKSWSEMTAEKMVYQIGTTGLSSSPAPRPMVTPASYIPD